MFKVMKILVPVDFSACSEAALDHAAYFAKSFGAEVDVLHVWEPPTYVVPETTVVVPGQPKRTLAEFARMEASKEMERFLATLEREGDFEVRGRLESGDATKTILRVAEEDNYDLIVMGTHGRTGITHLFLGSVAEKVVRRATCPVLTIRRAGGEEEEE